MRAERTTSVGGFIVKMDVGTDAGEAERGFSLDSGAGFSLSACVYIFSLWPDVLANRAVRMGAAFFGIQKWGRVGAGNHSLASSVRSNKAYLKIAPCVSTMFLHRLWRDMACACNAVPLGIAIFSDDAAITVSNTAVSSLRLAIGTCADLWTR